MSSGQWGWSEAGHGSNQRGMPQSCGRHGVETETCVRSGFPLACARRGLRPCYSDWAFPARSGASRSCGHPANSALHSTSDPSHWPRPPALGSKYLFQRGHIHRLLDQHLFQDDVLAFRRLQTPHLMFPCCHTWTAICSKSLR